MNERTRETLQRIGKSGLQILTALLVLLAFWGAAYLFVGNELLVPGFKDCMKKFGKLLGSVSFWRNTWQSLLRVLLAFSVSFILAVFFALIAYMLPWFYRFFSPIVSVLRSLPALAVLLILLVWWGAAYAPVAVAFLSLFPMLYTGILAALFSVDKEYIEMSRVYKVPKRKQIVYLYLPAAAPYVIRESGGALSFSLKLVVSAEVLANTRASLGGMMQEARLYLDIPLLFALVGVTFFVGLVIELLATFFAETVERRVR